VGVLIIRCSKMSIGHVVMGDFAVGVDIRVVLAAVVAGTTHLHEMSSDILGQSLGVGYRV
jgi:hypothetical protein